MKIYIYILIFFFMLIYLMMFKNIYMSNFLKEMLIYIIKYTMKLMYQNNQSMKKSEMILLCIMFMFFFIMNLLSLNMYNFSMTTSISFILFFSMSLIMCYNLNMIINKKEKFLYHLIPEGSPMLLSLFLFFIEMISSMIRPITLSIRITANILTGHLLVSLICLMTMNTSKLSMLMLMFMMLVESVVSLIQSYIYVCLMSMYMSEL